MSKRQLSAIALVCLLAAAGAYFAVQNATRAQASGEESSGEDESVTETAEPNPTIEPSPPPHDPFAPYPADEGALTWEDLTPDEQAGVEAMQEWAETANGAAVHNAFAAGAATTSAMREVEAAQTASGLDGIETLGVVP